MTRATIAERAIHAVALMLCTLACVAWSWAAGRDLNWDQLNYHVYAAYQYLDGRLDRDFMAASVQGYLNPLAYVPFYWMVRAQWPSLLIGSTLAVLHSICLWLVYGISLQLIPAGARYRGALVATGVALAFLTPVFLIEVGSSFIDVTTSIPVLGAILLLLYWQRSHRRSALVVLAGVLMGAATGLKVTNAIFPLAGTMLVWVTNATVRHRLGALIAYGLGGCAGLLLVTGAWSYRLYQAFGSPFFPWFNAWFRSADFPPFNIVSYRFMPESLGQVLAFPVIMLDAFERGYTESISPDGRLLALLVIVAAIGIARLRRRRGQSLRVEAAASDSSPAYRATLAFALLGYGLWLATSGNGRYAIPLLLLLGAMIPASMRVLTSSRRVLAYVLGALLLVQATMVWVIGPARWMPTEWKSAWFDIAVPPTLRERPFLYLSLNRQTASFLAPFLNSQSSFVNLVGQVSLAVDRPGGAHLQALLDRHQPNIRTLMIPSIPLRGGETLPSMIAFQNKLIARVGLEVDASDCISFEMQDAIGLLLQTASEAGDGAQRASDFKTVFLTCATKPLTTAREDPLAAQRRQRVDRAFDRIEAMCPRLFSPAGAYTDQVNEKLRRNYVNSDTELWELAGKVEYLGWRYEVPIELGRIEDIIDGKVHIDCRFARSPPSIVRE